MVLPKEAQTFQGGFLSFPPPRPRRALRALSSSVWFPKLPHFPGSSQAGAFPSLVRLCPASWCVYLRGSLISAFLTFWKAPLETGSILARVLELIRVFSFLCFSDCSELLRYKWASKELHQPESSIWKLNCCLPSFSISGFSEPN